MRTRMRPSVKSRGLWAAALVFGGTAAFGLTARMPKAQADGWDRRGDHDRDHEPDRYSVALWGDMPYGALGKQQYPNLLADVNASDVAFSIFDGDLKAGGDGPCTDENVYTPALGYLRYLEAAA